MIQLLYFKFEYVELPVCHNMAQVTAKQLNVDYCSSKLQNTSLKTPTKGFNLHLLFHL